MPIYEYLCKQCNTIFQFIVRHPSKDTLPICPKCNNRSMERVMSSFSFGSGHSSTGDGPEDDPSLAGLDEEDPEKIERDLEESGFGMDDSAPSHDGGLYEA